MRKGLEFETINCFHPGFVCFVSFFILQFLYNICFIALSNDHVELGGKWVDVNDVKIQYKYIYPSTLLCDIFVTIISTSISHNFIL